MLKLYVVSDADRTRYKEYLEPKGGQWCPRASCTFDSRFRLDAVSQGNGFVGKNCKGRYVRYGFVPGDNRTGDTDMYEKSLKDYKSKKKTKNLSLQTPFWHVRSRYRKQFKILQKRVCF